MVGSGGAGHCTYENLSLGRKKEEQAKRREGKSGQTRGAQMSMKVNVKQQRSTMTGDKDRTRLVKGQQQERAAALLQQWHKGLDVRSPWWRLGRPDGYLIGHGSLLGGVSSSSLLSTTGETFRDHCQLKTTLNIFIIRFTISGGKINLLC